uniref:Uncharacterized protein n=1 Tax=Nelumbo nucifera TaxID=4432 RepID=A0A822ZIP4_NELNU|nr:TPA_asm: hypothetical protein HUJ06_015891 [Nelumbo nucifera]
MLEAETEKQHLFVLLFFVIFSLYMVDLSIVKLNPHGYVFDLCPYFPIWH